MQATTQDQPELSRRIRRLLSRATGRHAAEGRLLSAAGGVPCKRLLVTCPRPGDGASVASLGLACALAASGLRVFWVDAHPSRPACRRYFRGLGNGPGLAQWLSGEVGADGMPAVADPATLFPCPQNTEITETDLRAADWPARLEDALSCMDYVIVDAGDLQSGSWPAHCARRVDGVLVAVSCRRNQTHDVAEAVSQLEHLDARLLGVILNRKKRVLPWGLDDDE
jgi:Mrp family chromosome partitioning ATPase